MEKINIKKVFLWTLAIILSVVLYYFARIIYALNNPACLVLDQTHKIEEFSKNGRQYFVYYAVTGWHDKVETYYLFDKEPTLSECGGVAENGLLSVHVPEKEIPKKIIIKQDDMELIYMTPKEIDELRASDTSPMMKVEIEVVGVPSETK